MDADGITYRDMYFLKRGLGTDESLHFHELVHIIQWQVLGPEHFILAYALGHVAGGGYLNNPFEKIAFDLQDRFKKQERLGSIELIVKQHLSQTVPALVAAASISPLVMV